MFEFLKERSQRRSAQKNLKIYSSMLDVADVASGYEYWRHILIGKAVRLFEYEGLPGTIPGTEAEKQALLLGKSGIVNSKYGFVAVPSQPYGVGLYPSYHPRAVWSTPLIKGDGIINKDIVIIRNDSFMMGISETIDRYSRLLSDTESTLALTLSNLRQPSMAAAPDEHTAISYQAALLAMRLGDTEAILNRSVLDDIKNIDIIRTIPSTLLSDIINAREKLISAFFAEIGVASRQDKRSPMTVTEVESDVQVMTVNVYDMLKSREESLEALRDVFGIQATVHISEAYKPIIDSKPDTFRKTGDPTTGRSLDGDDL